MGIPVWFGFLAQQVRSIMIRHRITIREPVLKHFRLLWNHWTCAGLNSRLASKLKSGLRHLLVNFVSIRTHGHQGNCHVQADVFLCERDDYVPDACIPVRLGEADLEKVHSLGESKSCLVVAEQRFEMRSTISSYRANFFCR